MELQSAGRLQHLGDAFVLLFVVDADVKSVAAPECFLDIGDLQSIAGNGFERFVPGEVLERTVWNAASKRRTKSQKLAQEALEIDAEEARAAGALGFMARILVQATLPHSRPKTHEFERVKAISGRLEALAVEFAKCSARCISQGWVVRAGCAREL